MTIVNPIELVYTMASPYLGFYTRIFESGIGSKVHYLHIYKMIRVWLRSILRFIRQLYTRSYTVYWRRMLHP